MSAANHEEICVSQDVPAPAPIMAGEGRKEEKLYLPSRKTSDGKFVVVVVVIVEGNEH
jgi:hypothetical protein